LVSGTGKADYWERCATSPLNPLARHPAAHYHLGVTEAAPVTHDSNPAHRIYLDNAATSFPKPPSVYDAMMRYARDIGASPGRGHYAESREGARIIQGCRQQVAAFIGGDELRNVIFTLNTSDALNLAIKGVARAARLRHAKSGGHFGDAPLRVVTTAIDHNSVLRPFFALAVEGATVAHVPADPRSGLVSIDNLRRAVTPDTTLVAINAVSNVTGAIQPVSDAAAVCRAMGVPCLVDAAQALGHTPFSLRECDADLLAFPGHKGLLGPQGTGGLYVRPGFEDRLATTREGGTGSISELDAQPMTMPERYEAGSHNTIGLAGLSEGVRWLAARGIDAIRAHEVELIALMLDQLRRAGCRMLDATLASAFAPGPLAALRLLGPTDLDQRTGTFSFVHDALTPAEIAMMLEQHSGILARAGLHCAPLAHQSLGTLGDAPTARGALRMSMGPFTTPDDIRAAVHALGEVCRTDVGCQSRVRQPAHEVNACAGVHTPPPRARA
jgi:cysteine desulfurase family protein